MRIRTLALSLLVAVTCLAGSSDQFPYVFKRGSGGDWVRVNGSIESFKKIQKRFSGAYIWFSRNGREYLIRDQAVMAEADRAFAEVEALQPQLDAAEKRLQPLEQKSEAIEDRIDEAGDRLGDEDGLSDAQRRTLEGQLRDAEREMSAIEDDLRAAEEAVERVDDEMERREKIAEKKFEAIVLKAIDSGKAERVD